MENNFMIDWHTIDMDEVETNIKFDPYECGDEIYSMEQFRSHNVFEILSVLELNTGGYVLEYGSNIKGTELSFAFEDVNDLLNARNYWNENHLVTTFINDIRDKVLIPKMVKVMESNKLNSKWENLSHFNFKDSMNKLLGYEL